MVLEYESDHLQAVILVLRARSDRAMSQQFGHFYSHGILFSHVSNVIFTGKFASRKLHSVLAVQMSRLPARLRGPPLIPSSLFKRFERSAAIERLELATA